MSRYLEHITISTGDVHRQYRSGRSEEDVAVLAEVLDQILLGGYVPVPTRDGYYVSGKHSGRDLIVTLWKGAAYANPLPILTTGVALRSRSAMKVWKALHDQTDLPIATDPDRPPRAPWIADRLELGAAVPGETALLWTGAFAACLGWAWVDYVEAGKGAE